MHQYGAMAAPFPDEGPSQTAEWASRRYVIPFVKSEDPHLPKQVWIRPPRLHIIIMLIDEPRETQTSAPLAPLIPLASFSPSNFCRLKLKKDMSCWRQNSRVFLFDAYDPEVENK